MSQKRRLCCPPEHSFHILKSEDNDFGHIHLENENDAGTFFSKVRDGEFVSKVDRLTFWHRDKQEFGTGRLVEFLRNDKNLSELKLDDNFFTKIMEENIPGRTFLKLTKSDLRECGVRLDPSLELEEYIQELGVKKYI
ncbi:unnamed protein product [Rhizophagus irregularis]|uniref:SAM domain-containing protein n=1 Tax=Rhizophagus irregularis TaxID=588596 RepID=A0A915YQV8_9GLOM|nr:unnamed protein product [Rhizophagus irregularis]